MVYSNVNNNGNGNGNPGQGNVEPTTHNPRSSVNSGSTVVDGHGANPRIKAPRSLPPWISSYEERYGSPSEDQLELLSPPPQSRLPQHNNAPYEPQSQTKPQRRASRDGYIDWSTAPPSDEEDLKKRGKKPRFKKGKARGRKWDHLRTAEPVIVTGFSQEPMTRWKDFMQSSRYGKTENEESHVVAPEYLDQLQPQFNQPFEMPQPSKKAKQKMTAAKFWTVLVQHPLVPLVFRLIVLVTSIIALALSARIFELEQSENSSDSAEKTQSLVAIIVDCLAVPYIGYMTWDEYTGQPLGLRSGSQKASLVLMDLFFIIFKAASTALSFEALVYHNARDDITLNFSRALAAFMCVGLISWSFSFSVNVFRLVYKLDDSDDEVGARWMVKSVESGLD